MRAKSILDTDFLGAQLAQAVLEVAGGDTEQLLRLVRRHAKSTTLNYLILLAWTASYRVSMVFPENLAHDILDSMHRPVYKVVHELTGWPDTQIERLLISRYRAYYTAWAKDDPTAAVHLLAYHFFACCTDMRIELELGEELPDREAIKWMVDSGHMSRQRAQLLYDAINSNIPTYPLDLEGPTQIGARLAAFGGTAEKVIEENLRKQGTSLREVWSNWAKNP